MPDILMPRLSESMTEGKLLRWSVPDGAFVHAGDVIAEVETDKANMEIEVLENGRLTGIRAFAGDMVPVGSVIAVLDTEATESDACAEPPPLPPAPTAFPAMNASPLAISIAEERGVELAQVQGTGRNGRITKEDVLNYIASRKAEARTMDFSPDEPEDSGGEVEAPGRAEEWDTTNGAGEITSVESPESRDMEEFLEIVSNDSPPAADVIEFVAPGDSEPAVERVPGEDAKEDEDTPLHEETDSGPVTEVVVISGLSLSSVTVDADVSSLTESLPVLATRVPRAADCPPGELLTAMVLRAASMAQADGLLLEPVAEAEPDSVAIGTPAGSGFEWRVVTGVRTRPLGVLLEETLRVAGEPAADPDVEDLSIPPSAIAVVNFGDLGVDGFAGLLDDSGVPVLSVGRVVDRPRLRDGRVQACRTVRLTLSAPAAEMRPLDGVRFLARVREILEHPVLLAGW